MKLSRACFGLLVSATALVNAQYFSEGWKPGQAVQEATEAAPEPTFTPAPSTDKVAPAKQRAGGSFIDNLLSSGPVADLFSKVGVNITERLDQHTNIWDERVELITDDNFNDLIVNEPLTEEQERDRTWIIVMYALFDKAFNETQELNDLPNVRWGRIDYLNVTYITTKWNVWSAPYLVVLKDRGQSLRFYKPYQLRLRSDELRSFLRTEGWSVTEPWKSAYGPGGDREYIMDFIATWTTKIYNLVVMVPRWMLMLISGGIASMLITAQSQTKRETPAPATAKAPVAASSAQETKRTGGGVKQRKSKK
ncbi:hypothetical protein BDQ17DRAFT_1352322 [Cyathus striatus]|nr:hypothetical protein BDQ17DRAFT_1352322 [Cyathus striatus]